MGEWRGEEGRQQRRAAPVPEAAPAPNHRPGVWAYRDVGEGRGGEGSVSKRMSFNQQTNGPTHLPIYLRCAREAQGEVARGARKRGSGSVMQASAHSCKGCVSRARKSRGSALPVVPASDLVDE